MGPLGRLLVLILACGPFAQPARGLAVHPDSLSSPPDHSMAPPAAMDPGWANTGFFGNGTAVYIGTNGAGEAWILTARHIANATFVLPDGSSFDTTGSVGFTNPSGGTADLRAWRLDAVPSLPGLTIAMSTPGNTTPLTIIGTGFAEDAFTCWDAGWTATGCPNAHSGYTRAVSRAQQWGTNRVLASPAVDTLASALGLEDRVFASQFDDAQTLLEIQATSGDSGGPAFVQNGAAWELAGIALAIGSIPNDPSRPANLSVLTDDYTFYVDLAFYRDQIIAGTGVPVPEPGSFGLVAAGLVLVAARRRAKAAVRRAPRGRARRSRSR